MILKLEHELYQEIFKKIKYINKGVPIVAQRLTNLTSICEDPSLIHWVKDPVLPGAVV